MKRVEIEEELRQLQRMRAMIDDRIAYFERQLLLRTQEKVASNGSIYTGVPAELIKPYLQEWIDQGHTLRTLADKAMLSESNLLRIMRGDRDMIRESTADKILSALGITHVYNEIVPEPPEDYHYMEE